MISPTKNPFYSVPKKYVLIDACSMCTRRQMYTRPLPLLPDRPPLVARFGVVQTSTTGPTPPSLTQTRSRARRGARVERPKPLHRPSRARLRPPHPSSWISCPTEDRRAPWPPHPRPYLLSSWSPPRLTGSPLCLGTARAGSPGCCYWCSHGSRAGTGVGRGGRGAL